MDNTGSCLKSCSFTLANSQSGKKTRTTSLLLAIFTAKLHIFIPLWECSSSLRLSLSCDLFHPTQHSLAWRKNMLSVHNVKHMSLGSFQALSNTASCSWERSSTSSPPYEPTGRFSAGESLWDCVFHSMPTSTPAILESLQL